jgi:hypothetical protein
MLKQRFLSAVAFISVLALASAAAAVTYPLSGSWQARRGIGNQIPIIGAPSFKAGATINATGAGFASLAGTGMHTIAASGALDRPAFPVAFPIPNPTLVQLATDFVIKAPGPGALGGGVIQQAGGDIAGRMLPSFNYCPGATNNPACTTHLTGGGNGTKHGIVKYTAGVNQWGATMGAFYQAGPLSSVTRIVGGTVPGPLTVRHDKIGTGAGMTQQVGQAYAFMNTVILPGGQVFTNAFTLGGLIDQANPGNLKSTAVAGSTNMNTGFPFTTGTVYVKVTNSPPVPTTFSVMGSNNLGAAGTGNITLVAGGLGHRLAGVSFAQLDTVTMYIPGAIPSLSRAGYVAGAALMALTIGFAMRRRF